MLPIPEYWQAVAKAIDTEDEKASIFIKHNASLGVAREEILKDAIKRHTPEPYQIGSGFIIQAKSRIWTTGQCDVLVYNPMKSQPFYQIGDISVVPQNAAEAAIEVKSGLHKRELKDILKPTKSVAHLKIPTFGFAFQGIGFNKSAL